ncbi:ABC transporter permease [Paenibacillus antibioticophila]|uniref:ABC transporter permease n=2 Tax=Paenibacillus antibioticophila TaxID=1274374 RepID=A0A919XQ99_9BACL|nr:ABC transporter permease [Paenibacillus antibioticophila]
MAVNIKKSRDIHSLSPFMNIVFNVIAAMFSLVCVFPFAFVVILSFTDEKSLAQHGYRLIPEKWSTYAYEYMFQNGAQLLQSYGVTITVTIVGTLLSVMIIALYAYGISRSSFKYRGFFSFLALFTMLFNGGLVPTFIVVTQVLHLKDTIWALILPMMMNAFNIMIMRTFFKSLPDGIIESAKIDGASEFQIFRKVVLPLSLPGLATIGLFCTLAYWNDWFNALLYIDNPNLVPLQSMLMRIESSMSFILQNSNMSGLGSLAASLPQETSRMAMVVLATGPIVLAYPFFQRFFIQGLTVGSLKE